MGHLLDHAAHAGNIENADIAIAEFRAVLHQHPVAVAKLRLHALTADRNDLIGGRNRIFLRRFGNYPNGDLNVRYDILQ